MGVNINPFVVIRVGEEKRHTATQKSTNCPFYNEVHAMDRVSITTVLVPVAEHSGCSWCSSSQEKAPVESC